MRFDPSECRAASYAVSQSRSEVVFRDNAGCIELYLTTSIYIFISYWITEKIAITQLVNQFFGKQDVVIIIAHSVVFFSQMLNISKNEFIINTILTVTLWNMW